MLKKRIIGNLVIHNNIVVQSIKFSKLLPIGNLEIAVDFLNQWGIDEIIISNISATKTSSNLPFDLYKQVSKKANVPLTIGGGIKSIEDIRNLLHCGADKIFLNSILFDNPNFLSESAKIFGDQCIIAAVDIIKDKNNRYKVYNYLESNETNIDAIEYISNLSKNGAGEILINSVNNDGMYCGFDLDFTSIISEKISLPVIMCGGAGKPKHFYDLFTTTNVSAGAAGNYFHFSEHSVIKTKSYLNKHKLDIRLETFANYHDNYINEENRLEKFEDNYLNDLLYKKITKEII
jgi:cyclase